VVTTPTTGFPPADTILFSGTAQECIHFLVFDPASLQVLLGTISGHYKMIAVDSSRYLHFWQARTDELEKRHCGGSIVACHTIGPQMQKGFSAFNLLEIPCIVRTGVKMAVENLFSQSQWPL